MEELEKTYEVRRFLTSKPVILMVAFLSIVCLCILVRSSIQLITGGIESFDIFDTLNEDISSSNTDISDDIPDLSDKITSAITVGIKVILYLFIYVPQVVLMIACIGYIRLIVDARKAGSGIQMSNTAFIILHITNIFFALCFVGFTALLLICIYFFLLMETFIFITAILNIIVAGILISAICFVLQFLFIIKSVGLVRSLITISAVVNGRKSRMYISSVAAVLSIAEGPFFGLLIMLLGRHTWEIIEFLFFTAYYVLLGINLFRLRKLLKK